MSVSEVRVRDVILGDKRHKNYNKTVEIADHLEFHVKGFMYEWYQAQTNTSFQYPNYSNYKGNTWYDIIVAEYRPQESKDDEAYNYRLKTYRPITKETCSSVITEYEKITRSADWSVKFPDESIRQDDDLQTYLNNDPRWGTFQNFVQQVLIQEICLDPNQLIAVLPDTFEVEDDTVRANPVVYFFKSKQVLDFVEGEYAIIKEDTEDSEPNKYWVIDNERVLFYQESVSDSKKVLILTGEYEYQKQIEGLNVRKLRGVFNKDDKSSPLFDSFLSPMLSSLDKASREDSDLDAAKVRSMFPQKWQIKGLACKQCNGSGKVPGDGQNVECTTCKGSGAIISSPSQTIIVDSSRLDQSQIPTPPADYISPPTDIIKLQKETIKEHQKAALASINMQFLDRTPLNESGKSKEVDRDSLNTSIYKVASNLVGNMEFIVKYTNDFRFPDVSNRDQMLPSIAIPIDYSIITDAIQLGEFKDAKEAGTSPSTLRDMEIQFVAKKYRNNPKIREKSVDYILLNPLYGMGLEQIGNARLTGTVTELDAITSTYIIEFVDRAYSEDNLFNEKTLEEKKEIITGFAKEKMEVVEPNLDDGSGDTETA